MEPSMAKEPIALTPPETTLLKQALGKFEDLTKRSITSAKYANEPELTEIHEKKLRAIQALYAKL